MAETKTPEAEAPKQRVRRTDEELVKVCEDLYTSGITTGAAMLKAVRHTENGASQQRFLPIAQKVIAGHGGPAKRTSAPKAGTTDRLAALKAERQAVKDWEALPEAERGDRPATPLHDAAEAEEAKKAAKAVAKARPADTKSEQDQLAAAVNRAPRRRGRAASAA